MPPHDPILPDEEKQIADLPEGQNGVPQSSGFCGKTPTFWSRFLVWSQFVAIAILTFVCRANHKWLEWLHHFELLRFVISGAALVSALYVFFICPVAVLFVSLANPKRRDGCLLIVLELLLFYVALIAFLPGV